MVSCAQTISRIQSWPEEKRANMMNGVKEMTQSSSCWSRHVSARLCSSLGGVVANVGIAALRIISLPLVMAEVPFKLLVKTVRIIVDAQWLQKLDHHLCGISDVFRTAFKALGAAFAAAFSATIGFLSPRANVFIHQLFGFMPLEKSVVKSLVVNEVKQRDGNVELLRLLLAVREHREKRRLEIEAEFALQAQVNQEAPVATTTTSVVVESNCEVAIVEEKQTASPKRDPSFSVSALLRSVKDTLIGVKNDFIHAVKA